MHEFFSANPEPLSAPLRAALETAPAFSNGRLPLPEFVRIALYHPVYGYYQQARTRIGRDPAADFYTAASVGPVFRELVVAAACELLRCAGLEPAASVFVEIGPESDGGLLGAAPHPFAAATSVRPGEPLRLPARAVVFANEVLDAQPFQRFVRLGGHWREACVRIAPAGLSWDVWPDAKVPAEISAVAADDGALIDWPSGAETWLRAVCAEPWQGALIACDYGHDSDVLLRQRPQGTARGYFRHSSSSNILRDAGNRDITCHVAWDRLEAILADSGCRSVSTCRQESFFVTLAQAAIADILSRTAACFSAEKQALSELLHPHHMGSKFQVISALRI